MLGYRKNLLFGICVIVPLMCGLFIYLTKVEQTYISEFFPLFRSLIRPVEYPYVIKNYACDFLWAFSMLFCFRLTLGERFKGKNNIILFLLTSIMVFFLELIQIKKSIPGTFDWIDIVVELIAVLIAGYLTYKIERRSNYEKS